MNIFKGLFKQRQAFVAYITAGQQADGYTEQAALALAAGGVDILELGVPFSDPIADGPIIQEAMASSIKNKTTIKSVLAMVKAIKAVNSIPIVLFTYYNPLLAMGVDSALCDAVNAGVDGVLVVDLPPEESHIYFQQCQRHKIEPICLISPTTDSQRIKKIAAQCDSFLYYVCRNGVTGIKNTLPHDYKSQVSRIKEASKLPVVSGFGIGNTELAAQALTSADGFVVGSAFVNAISNKASPNDLKQLAMKIDPR